VNSLEKALFSIVRNIALRTGALGFLKLSKWSLESNISLEIVSVFKVETILDIGANIGQFAYPLAKKYPKLQLISVEADPNSFKKLLQNSKKFPSWESRNCAVTVGTTGEIITLHVASNNGASSSLLDSTDLLKKIYPNVVFKSRIEVIGKNFRELISEIGDSRIYLKMDIQGYERTLIESIALSDFPKLVAISLEVSNLQLYKDEWDVSSAIRHLEESNFKIYSITTEDFKKELGTIQFNLHFHRNLV
jgi:FkbM family methyltransferase